MHSENAFGGVCVTCIFSCMPGENYLERRQLRSLLLCLCDVIRALSVIQALSVPCLLIQACTTYGKAN